MASTSEEQGKKLVGRIVSAAKRTGKGRLAADTEAFIRAFYDRVPVDDIANRAPADLAAQAVNFLKFAHQRKPGKPLLRIFNPAAGEHGWEGDRTVIEVVNDNMPFLVDSIAAALNFRRLGVHLVIHPVLRNRRDGKGVLKAVNARAKKGAGTEVGESFIHVEMDRLAAVSEIKELTTVLNAVLSDVRASVEDWMAMRGKLTEVVADLEASRKPPDAVEYFSEVREFLKWLDDDHYTFLGYRRYDFTQAKGAKEAHVVAGSGLGVLRDPAVRVFYADDSNMPRDVRSVNASDGIISIAKANRRATVHRPIHMDTIGIELRDGDGVIVGEHRFVGLFTSHAYSLSPRFIPVLRRKIAHTMSRAGFDSASHDGKALLHILETYPRDELFQVSDDELLQNALGILHLQERQRTALFERRDPFGRFMSCLVFTPKEVYSSNLRERFSEILCKAFNGTVSAFYTQIGDEPLARIHFIIKTDPTHEISYNKAALERDLAAAARSWDDELHDVMIAAHKGRKGLDLFHRFAKAFPVTYRDTFSPSIGVHDADKIEEALETGHTALHLYRRQGDAAGELRLKIFHPDGPLPLSDALPMLENMGLRVIEEIPFEVTPNGAGGVWVHDFGLVRRVLGAPDAKHDFTVEKELFEDALARVQDGEAENEGFNKLVLAEGLDWREVVLVRAYSKYLRQARAPFSQDYMVETFIRNPGFARLLVDLFRAKFDPSDRARAESREVALKVAYEESLERVSNLDEDRILRRFLNLVLATLRTNHYQKADHGGFKDYVSFKLASGDIDNLPLPRPWREIWVYSPRMEGIHLRSGAVARGGIRWSDRREDFRTEILGLMKAQVVKNPVIVPVGAKGGFVVKKPPTEGGREAFQAEGIECYKMLMRGLLDITDNRAGERIIAPRDVIRHDDDDPYLVVAADKGTATFSDIANGVARDYGFWLDDAFASGGSVGYDHKKMGITARGAWESVKRHFRETGKDIQKEDFTCVGVGDMAGDVFGNGMLLSPHTCLVAAFNHMHIFLDPNPDPAAAIKERRRLFNTPRSTWADYNKKLISKGGGVFERSAKSITLSAEIKARFGITASTMSPDDLIRSLLTASVELLWFGGIGTFIKAAHQNHADAGDRANDNTRVNAKDLNCTVIGEGANLGMTQAARIEYARNGGRLNTDSVDNSAGVDCSDHEVNIKILLAQVVAAKKLTMKARDKLLVEMTDDVATLVLRDNYLQTGALSLAETEAAERLSNAQRLTRVLERVGRLNRAVDGLPDEETFGQLSASGLGLTRPELSVLLAFSKLHLNDELLASDIPDEKILEIDLIDYFPKALRKKYRAAIGRHRLKREIIATVFNNEIVNRAGFTFVNDIRERTGRSSPDIARAFAIVRDSFCLPELWAGIEALDNKVSAATQIDMQRAINRLLERAVIWFMEQGDHPLDIGTNIEKFGPGIAELIRSLNDVLADSAREALAESIGRYKDAGVPEKLARPVCALAHMNAALDIVCIAGADSRSVPVMARVYFGIGARFGFDWLRNTARRIETQTGWQRQAVQAMIDELYGLQHDLVTQVIDAAGAATAVDAIVSVWADARKELVARTEQTLADMQAAPSADLAMVAVALRQLRVLVTG